MSQQPPASTPQEKLKQLREKAEQLQAAALKARRRASQALEAYREYRGVVYGVPTPSTGG